MWLDFQPNSMSDSITLHWRVEGEITLLLDFPSSSDIAYGSSFIVKWTSHSTILLELKASIDGPPRAQLVSMVELQLQLQLQPLPHMNQVDQMRKKHLRMIAVVHVDNIAPDSLSYPKLSQRPVQFPFKIDHSNWMVDNQDCRGLPRTRSSFKALQLQSINWIREYSAGSLKRPCANKTALGYKIKNRCAVFARQMTKIQNWNFRLSYLGESYYNFILVKMLQLIWIIIWNFNDYLYLYLLISNRNYTTFSWWLLPQNESFSLVILGLSGRWMREANWLAIIDFWRQIRGKDISWDCRRI